MHGDLLQRSSLITSKRNFNPLKLYSRKDVHEFLLYAIIVVIVSKKGQDIEKIWPEPRTSSVNAKTCFHSDCLKPPQYQTLWILQTAKTTVISQL